MTVSSALTDASSHPLEWLLLRRQQIAPLCAPDWALTELELWQGASGHWILGRFGSGPECDQWELCRPQRAIRLDASAKLVRALATVAEQLTSGVPVTEQALGMPRQDRDQLWLFLEHHQYQFELTTDHGHAPLLQPLIAALDANIPELGQWPVVAMGGQYL